MPVFARSDVLSVTVSRAHGGCGEVHRRPFNDDSPVRVWRLSCPLCQGHLSHDPLWSGNEGTIPATPDETQAVENSNTLFSRNRDDIMTMALARLAGLPEGGLLRGNGNTAAARQALVKCPDGHDNFPGTKFCGECGTKLAVDDTARAGVMAAALDEAARTGKPVQTEHGIALPPSAKVAEETPARQPRQPRQPRVPKDVPVPAPTQASAEEELRGTAAPRPVSLEDELLSAPSI